MDSAALSSRFTCSTVEKCNLPEENKKTSLVVSKDDGVHSISTPLSHLWKNHHISRCPSKADTKLQDPSGLSPNLLELLLSG